MSALTIKETRQLVLPLQTVLDAVVQLDRIAHGSLSRGEVLQAEFIEDAEASGMNVAVMSAEDGAIEWRRFSVDDLAAAIINFCRSKRIPLPFAGAKSLAITKEGAAFTIENSVDLAQSARPAARGPQRYARGYEPHALLPLTRDKAAV